MKSHDNQQRGFTLVELSVALIIIGLLIGGILKGQEMINNGKVTDTVKQAQSFMAAHYGFFDIYRGYPGDLISARDRLKNCTAANTCDNGNGDSTVGERVANMGLYNSSDESELTQYWKHLGFAELIAGVDPYAPAATPSFGTTHPASKVGGGFNVATFSTASFEYTSGALFMLTSTPNTADMFFPPSIAQAIDSKMDDGRPNTGSVFAEATATNCDDDPTNTYRPDSMNGTCNIFFVISSH